MQTVAVISDLHAYETHEGDAAPSHFRAGASEDLPGHHPVADLLTLIRNEALRADLLLSPGDLGDRADPVGIKAAWTALDRMKNEFGAALCLATAGNHDLDSRFKHADYDARGYLQGLDPMFPLADEREYDRYWSRHFAAVDTGAALVVLLNSCAYHGSAVAEIAHGRVSDRTVHSLIEHVRAMPRRDVQILLCHHHPQQHMEMGLGEFDVMRGGQILLDSLGDGTIGRWLVVHGHKHHPKITYAAGSATSPVILSAASFSVTLYQQLQTRTKNQFHLIELPAPSESELGFVGTIRSWEWSFGLGWKAATGSSGLPPECGFGFRGDPDALAKRVDKTLSSPKMTWGEIKALVPELGSLVPQDLESVRRSLADKHGIAVLSNNGVPSEIGRRPT